jgi:hypothetical protein
MGDAMARGSCLCGEIAFEIDREGVAAVTACYCVSCRKVSGAQFGVYLQVRSSGFRWIAGEDKVETFESSPGNLRGRCRTCGSIAPINTNYGVVRVPGGALDEDPGVCPDIVLYERSKAAWCGAETAMNRFEDMGPPAFWQALTARLFGQNGQSRG